MTDDAFLAALKSGISTYLRNFVRVDHLSSKLHLTTMTIMIKVMICNSLCRAQGNQESIGAVQSTELGLVCVSEKYFDGRRKQDQVNNAISAYIS